MKHVKALSNKKPALATETAWVEWKNIFGPLPLAGVRLNWLAAQIDMWLQR